MVAVDELAVLRADLVRSKEKVGESRELQEHEERGEAVDAPARAAAFSPLRQNVSARHPCVASSSARNSPIVTGALLIPRYQSEGQAARVPAQMERSTRQRQAIQQAIEAAGRPLNAGEVLAAATAVVPCLGIATVYRTLKAFAQSGLVEIIELPGEPVRYEAAGKGHHDHFRCSACERVFEVEDCPVRGVRLPKGFVADGHQVIFHGTCADCRSGSAGSRARFGRPPEAVPSAAMPLGPAYRGGIAVSRGAVAPFARGGKGRSK